MIRSSRDDYREAGSDCRPSVIENCLTGSFLDAKELIEGVDFRPDLFPAVKDMTTSWQCFAV